MKKSGAIVITLVMVIGIVRGVGDASAQSSLPAQHTRQFEHAADVSQAQKLPARSGSRVEFRQLHHALANGRHIHAREKGHRGLSWRERDRAVYVVSTLNAPLCGDNQQLSSVLKNDYGARLYYVARSTAMRDVYYVLVRQADQSPVGVFVYKFGWKLPQGVQDPRCVAIASPKIGNSFNSHRWKIEAHFTSTYPQG